MLIYTKIKKKEKRKEKDFLFCSEVLRVNRLLALCFEDPATTRIALEAQSVVEDFHVAKDRSTIHAMAVWHARRTGLTMLFTKAFLVLAMLLAEAVPP